MKRSPLLFISLLCLVTVALSGCFLKSVHPLFTAEDAVMLPNLDGTYEDEEQRWIFASDQNPEIVADLVRQYPSEDISIEPEDKDSLGIPGYLILYKDLSKPNRSPVFGYQYATAFRHRLS